MNFMTETGNGPTLLFDCVVKDIIDLVIMCNQINIRILSYRDQDGESDDIKDTTKDGPRGTSIISGDRMQGGKSMSIMNTQHSSKDKVEQISTQRNTSSASDNRASSTYHHAHPSLIPPSAPITSGNGNSTNNSINSVANTGNNALDTSSSSSHLPSNSTGSTISSNQLKDQK